MNKKKLPLAFWIFIGLVVGIAVGLALMMVPNGLDIAKNYILPWGTIFLNLLKFIVVPIVLFSIASGVISMQDIGRVGSVGGKTIVYYMCTTAFAVVLALVLASAAKGMHIFAAMETSGLAYEPPAGQSLMQTIIDIFPSNPITPLANASMLQVIVISLLVGFGILLAGEKGLVAAQVVDSFNEVSMKIMDLIHQALAHRRGLPDLPGDRGKRAPRSWLSWWRCWRWPMWAISSTPWWCTPAR